MILGFFDESKCQPDNPYYHIGAICLDEATAFAIEKEITTIALEVFDDSQLSSATEFHAVDIYHGKKVFRGMTNPAEKVAILAKFVEILPKKEVGLSTFR
ncbi:hypothetical protein KXD93_16715 [Mucilaginibacter sp. BJC16-A38]|uniref:hypothetical protein n=1 Tax=Mucilaginibacter phenanthrenivorans TaxID=1234842 RepID=UPI002157D924|nr:hypothetical protein [Mucilaginibacter phenanthrenivorans]MCR8559302.1 hypothetical protein [Mucilaginibacter phenanthrenivorans]